MIITPSMTDELRALCRRICTCKRDMVTPAFHAHDCPYTTQGDEYLRMALKQGVMK